MTRINREMVQIFFASSAIFYFIYETFYDL
ncbi:hypothetical protein LINGRAHAP2_LOCUS9645 [Linum grandiflorum]